MTQDERVAQLMEACHSTGGHSEAFSRPLPGSGQLVLVRMRWGIGHWPIALTPLEELIVHQSLVLPDGTVA